MLCDLRDWQRQEWLLHTSSIGRTSLAPNTWWSRLGSSGFGYLAAGAQRLRQHGLSAVVCSPQGGESCWQNVLESVQHGAMVVFMSPERALKEVHSQGLQQLRRVSLVAIDEAHCVSEWGHDFRALPAYLQPESTM
eukprot:symbB.v1.2.016910.t1/scaffold1304.1/size242089/4